MQEVADVQDTAASRLLWEFAGAGACWMVHADPFQASASGVGLPLEPGVWPAASPEVGAVQETELRLLLTDPGVVCATQEVPFHAAAFSPVGPSPTASQNVADRHETDPTKENPVTLVPVDHDDPFQVATPPKPFTSMQKSAVAQDTSCGSTSASPGIASIVQD